MNVSLVAALAACCLLQASDVSKHLAVLERESDAARLEEAAVAIIASGDAKAIGQLARHLGSRSFLRRLEQGRSGESDSHFRAIFRALEQHPSPATELLCIDLARNAVFTSEPWRLNFLLTALAAIQPLSAEAATIFRETSRSGYLEVNGPLLARNATPHAIAVLEDVFADHKINAAQLVSVAHRGLLPVRTDETVVAMCSRLVLSGRLSPDVQTGIIESLFDYQPRRWFGVALNPPVPPAWTSAREPAKAILRALGTALLNRSDLSAELRTAIQATLKSLS